MSTTAELAGAYRFLNHEKVTSSSVLAPHRDASLRRASLMDEVLVVHDRTTLTFKGSTRTELEETSKGETQSCFAQLSLLVDPARSQPLGVTRLSHFLNPPRTAPEASSKEARQKESRLRRRARPKEERLSREWWHGVEETQALFSPTSHLTHVIDCDADDYALFTDMDEAQYRFIIRGNHDRSIRQNGQRRTLSDVLIEAPAVAGRQIELSSRPKQRRPDGARKHPPRPARTALVEIGVERITLPRTKSCDSRWPRRLELNVVFVREPNPPEGMEPVSWKLWTNLPVETPEQVVRCVDWYCLRWLIEEYFRVWKSVCRVERRELESRDALMNMAALLAPAAWHLMLLRNWERTEPTKPAAEVWPPLLLQTLECFAERYPLPPNPTVQQAMFSLGGLGGHLKHNGAPGLLVLSRGYHKLLRLADGFAAGLQAARAGAAAHQDVLNR
jgi:hypothetical protein